MGDPSTSSAKSKPHSVFCELKSLLNDIPSPICILSNPRSSSTSTDGDEATAPIACLNCKCCRSAKELDEMKRQVGYIESALGKMSRFEQGLRKQMEALQEAKALNNNLLDEPGFKELIRAVDHFNFQLPYTSLYEFPKDEDGSPTPPKDDAAAASTPPISELLSSRYEALSPKEQKCLWCCSAFDGLVKKRELINWWIGEQLLDVSRIEEEAESRLKMVEDNGFMWRKSWPASDTWGMEPCVRSFIASKAVEAEFFDPSGNILDKKAILLRSDSQFGTDDDSKALSHVETVFNLNKLTITEMEAEKLGYIAGLQVLHLGRVKPNQHIQVKGLRSIMKRVNKMKQLKVLSLGGISSIKELPNPGLPSSLMVLDLRACQALEGLPSSIGGLKHLKCLDVSGCLILHFMPKGISRLKNIEVLKGFVIRPNYGKSNNNCCTLQDLKNLEKLHKLSICVWTSNFPQHQDLIHLASIKGLVKLKIQWTAASRHGQDNADNQQVVSKQQSQTMFTCCLRNQMEAETETDTDTYVFEGLKKLDLWCAPEDATSVLLYPNKFPTLKQLYIRGAKLRRLNSTWQVNYLRLLCLSDFQMKWEDLRSQFPLLSLLEMRDCPNLGEFSEHCDAEGVWKAEADLGGQEGRCPPLPSR